MSQQQPLVGDVPVTSYQPVSKYESPRAKTALIVMISVLATSAIFMGVILGVMHRAQPQVERAQLVLGRAEQIMDYPSRVLHGNVFHVATNLLQTNWLDLSRNTTKLTTALQQIFNVFDDYDQYNTIAKYASLATSIASKIGWIKPNWSPSPIPGPSDDEGVVNILSYISEWASQQTNRKDLADLAASCDAVTANLLTIDWSGRYSWGKGRGYGAWDVNNWKQTVTTVQDYCRQFAKLPALVADDVDAELVDPVPEPQPDNTNANGAN